MAIIEGGPPPSSETGAFKYSLARLDVAQIILTNICGRSGCQGSRSMVQIHPSSLANEYFQNASV